MKSPGEELSDFYGTYMVEKRKNEEYVKNIMR
jgi:hypothetical protein